MREGHGGEDEVYGLDKKLIGRRQWRRDQADGEIRNIKPRSGLDRYRPTRGITAWGEKGPAGGGQKFENFWIWYIRSGNRQQAECSGVEIG